MHVSSTTFPSLSSPALFLQRDGHPSIAPPRRSTVQPAQGSRTVASAGPSTRPKGCRRWLRETQRHRTDAYYKFAGMVSKTPVPSKVLSLLHCHWCRALITLSPGGPICNSILKCGENHMSCNTSSTTHLVSLSEEINTCGGRPGPQSVSWPLLHWLRPSHS